MKSTLRFLVAIICFGYSLNALVDSAIETAKEQQTHSVNRIDAAVAIAHQ